MVEFVIAGPIAILVILALIQLGMMMVAKQVLNEAAFEAARVGATEHASKDEMMRALKRQMLPFYQDSTNKNDFSRLANAVVAETTDLSIPIISGNWLTLTILNPPTSAFDDFGINDSGHRYIPNDNLEFRLYSNGGGNDANNYRGPNSHLTIQDANVLRIQVKYGYELKVPLMKTVFANVMCAAQTSINAFGGSDAGPGLNPSDCSQYYRNGRAPIVSYATVQMQSPAWKQN